MPKTNAQRGEEVRERLRAAAAELIPELGWGSVSTRLIAERAGLAPGLVHYHFASVQALLREVAIHVVADTSAVLLARLDPLNVDEGVDAILNMLQQLSGDDPVSLTLTEAYLGATRDAELRDALVRELDSFQTRLSDWLRRGGSDDPNAQAVILAALVDGIMLQRALGSRRPPPELSPVIHRMFRKGTTT